MIQSNKWFIMTGLWICSLVFWGIGSFSEQKSDSFVKKSKSLPLLFCHEQPEQIAYDRSFVNSDWSKSLKSLFKREQMSKEWQERFTLEYKKGKNFQKNTKNTNFLSDLLFFMQVICSNHKRITHIDNF